MFSVRTVRFGYLFSVLAVSVRTVRFGYVFSLLAVPVRAVPVHSVPVRFMAFMQVLANMRFARIS